MNEVNEDRLYALISERSHQPMTLDELAETLEVEGEIVRGLLEKMERRGQVILTRKKKYGLPEKMGLVVGKVQAHPKGFAFLIPDKKGQDDVFLPAEALGGAMHGDRVVVRAAKKVGNRNRTEGEIIRVLTRANLHLVGTFERNKESGFLTPDEARIHQDIFIPPGGIGGARDRDKVVVEITSWPGPRRNAEGRVVEVLGKSGDPGVDVLSIIRKYGLPEAFPPEVLLEAEKIPGEISPMDLQGRRDLRSWETFTIDGADAKDLDDAVSLTMLPSGKYRLGVHIADVSHYVSWNGKLDEEARQRGTSVYLVDRVVPMLPPRLSNGICSLNAGEDRLTLSAVMDIDGQGKVTRHELFSSVIRVDKRMVYDNVNKVLGGQQEGVEDYSHFLETLRKMNELAVILRSKRKKMGALDFDFPECKVVLDAEGHPLAVKRHDRGVSEGIIEEFMLLANGVVARRMQKEELPSIYRVHEEPGSDSLEGIQNFLKPLGLALRKGKVQSSTLQRLLEQVSGKPVEQMVKLVILRSMKHARYEAQPLGHFGLSTLYYCHFTSPIRRYPDLVVHRILSEYLASGMGENRLRELGALIPGLAELSSEREKLAEEAERESLDMKKVEYMLRHLGEVFPGVVSGVTGFGFFVQLDNTIEGLIHVSNLADDYYQFVEERLALVGQHKHRVISLGQSVKVKVVRVDVEARQIDFDLLEIT